MILTIKRFVKHLDAHLCYDEEGKTHYVDLFADGTLNKTLGDMTIDERDAYNESIVGETVHVDYLNPFQEIAHNVKILSQ